VYQLLKLLGADPEKVTEIKIGTADQLQALYDERDKLNAKSGDILKERHAVRLAKEYPWKEPKPTTRTAATS
jgi:hypothetical protein